jgi:hypothetical protein
MTVSCCFSVNNLNAASGFGAWRRVVVSTSERDFLPEPGVTTAKVVSAFLNFLNLDTLESALRSQSERRILAHHQRKNPF